MFLIMAMVISLRAAGSLVGPLAANKENPYVCPATSWGPQPDGYQAKF